MARFIGGREQIENINQPTAKSKRFHPPFTSRSAASPAADPARNFNQPNVINLRRTTPLTAQPQSSQKQFEAAVCIIRRGGRVAEGARLESVFRGNSNVGSNPTLSASNSLLPKIKSF
jgi:hypothetical protein